MATTVRAFCLKRLSIGGNADESLSRALITSLFSTHVHFLCHCARRSHLATGIINASVYARGCYVSAVTRTRTSVPR